MSVPTFVVVTQCTKGFVSRRKYKYKVVDLYKGDNIALSFSIVVSC